MICKKCRDNYSYINAESLKLNENRNCKSCKLISDKLDNLCLKANSEYKYDLKQWLYLNTPIKDGDRIIMGNSKNYDFPRFDENKLIVDTIKYLNFENKVFYAKEEKYNAINKILGILYDDFYNKIGSHTVEHLFALLTCLEYNRFMSLGIFYGYREKSLKIITLTIAL